MANMFAKYLGLKWICESTLVCEAYWWEEKFMVDQTRVRFKIDT